MNISDFRISAMAGLAGLAFAQGDPPGSYNLVENWVGQIVRYLTKDAFKEGDQCKVPY